MTIDIRKLSANIGAEVHGINPADDLDHSTIDELRRLLLQHQVLAFDAPGLTVDQHEQFVARFGPLTGAHPTLPPGRTDRILEVDSATSQSNVWHTDVTFIANPVSITTLRSVVIPPYGGETLIASATAAYQSLPDTIRRWADTLWAVHTNRYDYVSTDWGTGEDQPDYLELFESRHFESRHPVVRVHPETGERGLFIGGFVSQIEGLSATESRDLLRLLQAHVTKPEHVISWSWRPDQLLVFDNRVTQHYAPDNFDSLPRRLERVTVAGDLPRSVDGELSSAIVGDASYYSEIAGVPVAA